MCVCLWERERNVVRGEGVGCEGWWVQGQHKGSVCAGHGTVLAGTHVHIRTHTCQKQRLIVDIQPSSVRALQSHIVSHPPSFSYLSLSSFITNVSVCFLPVCRFPLSYIQLLFFISLQFVTLSWPHIHTSPGLSVSHLHPDFLFSFHPPFLHDRLLLQPSSHPLSRRGRC